MLHRGYVALGANLGNPVRAFEQAIQCIHSRIGEIQSISSFYRSEPMTVRDSDQQPMYLNAVLSIDFDLEPREVLRKLHTIERELGREREVERLWGARLIDLDLLSVDSLIVRAGDITVPHPGIHKRDFVLYPLLEVEPEFVHPELEVSVLEMILALERQAGPFTLSRETRERVISRFAPELRKVAGYDATANSSLPH